MIVVAEKNSQTLRFPYYCSVKVSKTYGPAEEEESTTDPVDEIPSVTGDPVAVDGPTLEEEVSSGNPGTDPFVDENIDYDITYTLATLDAYGKTTLKFDQDVDMQFVEDNFDSLFTHFYRYNDYRFTPEDHQVKSIATTFRAEDNAIDMEVKFDWPFYFGLLTEKNDLLFFNKTTGFDYCGMFVDPD